jgi:hypothetical protein
MRASSHRQGFRLALRCWRTRTPTRADRVKSVGTPMKVFFKIVLIAAVLPFLVALIGPFVSAGSPLHDLGRWMARGFGGGYR